MLKVIMRLKIAIRKIINRCPPRLRPLGGPLLGGIIGLIGGIPGFFIGLLLGYLLRELFVQSFVNKRLGDYFENPGLQRFYEAEPGLAAWCALAVLVSSADNLSAAPQSPAVRQGTAAGRILKQVILEASCVFSSAAANPLQIEHFSRMALSMRDRLNHYLLAESFLSRRSAFNSPAGDLQNKGLALCRLASGANSRQLSGEICRILDPCIAPSFEREQGRPGGAATDPWKILGLSPGAAQREIKSHYRRLAKLFHPDELEVLDEQRRETAARAFISIKEAYQEVMAKR